MILLCPPFLLSPPLPLGSFLVIAPAKLCIIIIIIITLLPNADHTVTANTRPWRTGTRGNHGDEIAGILARILVLPNQVPQFRISGIDELQGREPAFILDARVGPGLEHHLDEGGSKGSLGGGLGVEPADCGVERGVAFKAVDGVAFE